MILGLPSREKTTLNKVHDVQQDYNQQSSHPIDLSIPS
ncbi:hypothetical protein LD85_0550 [Saccharolobus islandicus L.D.8.5]|uniref:Uncharacterized protein n=1 Tax=Saccharolobus islandicus (strain L.D.8.5 / Lassen \|nr:hypothetical protein LD85_0550 [Sulfolobus islandicus L.D.8.5]